MGTEPIVESQTGSYRYEAVVRISEAIAACREPEELARTLADEIGKFLQFDHLYFIVFKENSKEIEYHVWGKGPISSWPDLLIEELPLGRLYAAGIHNTPPIGTRKSGFPDSENGQRKWA